jgi:DNA-binding transcriptional ArsR family regulator
MAIDNGHATGTNGFGNGNGNVTDSLPINWEHLARATAHPLRVSILEVLGMDGGRTLSPRDLSEELQIPLSNTNYHVTELAKAKIIALVRERKVRGATEHFYRIPPGLTPRNEKRTTGLEPATSTAELGRE